jgi:hypothetical protein
MSRPRASNDHDTPLKCEEPLNQAKRAYGPEQWMPPANRCRYVEIWTAVKHRWGLSADASERAALVDYADICPNNIITVARR